MSEKNEHKLITLDELKPINSQLAASACKKLSLELKRNSVEQSVRDEGLKRLNDLIVIEKCWVSQPEDKYLRVIWEGLFFSKSSFDY